jgi:hypothetical protein
VSRLTYSRQAFIRSLDMSGVRLNVFVEGRTVDAFIYGQLCTMELPPGPLQYKIIRADELPNGTATGGKAKLIDLFLYLRHNKKLTYDDARYRHSTLFFLDKDIDDLRNSLRRSPHIMYTETCDIENVVFRGGNLVTAIAATLSIDPAVVRSAFPDSTTWCDSTSSLWKEWISFCVMARKYGVGAGENDRRPSPLNTPLHSITDPAKVAQQMADTAVATGLSVFDVRQLFDRICRRVEQLFSQRRGDSIFKGKWYAAILEAEIRTLYPMEHARCPAFVSKVTTALQATLDFAAAWSTPFRTAIAAAAALP